MKVLKRKMLNLLLAFVMVFSFAFSGWGGIFTAMSVKAETTTVNLTYKSMQFQNNTENAGTYWTSICFYPSVGDGVSSGNPSGAIAADFSDLLAKLKSTSDVREDKVAELEQRVDAGQYFVSSADIASSILANRF